jgi:D-alanyl-lipoteichoic acid acyltransferase DltB (MBOAT superfamily)
LLIEACEKDYFKKKYLFLSIIINLGILFIFKYFNFANETVHSLVNISGFEYHISNLDILLPIGVSFYSFQAVAYTFDVYNEKIKPERHLGHFALFISFFPKLISGPIERGADFLPQIKQKVRFDIDRINSGFQLFLWGIFKKVVIADRLQLYVDMVYSNPHDYSGKSLILATWFFTIQIYCDFSAYTDMAIGCGRMLGFDISKNFNFPYFARSINDFWKRWHITLTSWFRDYLYFPLGGNRVSYVHWLTNIMIVFLISGLWHGANWTFIVWGGLHGLFYLVEQKTGGLTKKISDKLKINDSLLAIFQTFLTFNLVAFAWIFFRADTFDKAIYISTHLFSDFHSPLRYGSSEFTTIITMLLLFMFVSFECLNYYNKQKKIIDFESLNHVFKSAWVVSILIITCLFGVSSNNFIYFHF